MAVMIETRTLRGKPEDGSTGPSLGVQVKRGTKVKVLGTLPPSFVQIETLGLPEQLTGWVTESAIDRNTEELPSLAGGSLASVVVVHADTFGVNAHFLIAYAHMRSAFKLGDFAGGAEKGPFGISAAEWAFYGDRPDFGVEFPANALDEWRSQSLVSAVRLMLIQNSLTDAIARTPTWAEIALAVMCGPNVIKASIAEPSKNVVDLLTVGASVDKADIQARFSEFIADQTVANATEKIAAKLQSSADETRPLIEALIPDDGSGQSEISDSNDGASRGDAEETGKLIDVSEMDLDALARVAASEVGHFGKYGEDQLRGGLEAVVDTIFNRVAHVAFPDNIQRVIDQPKQFSAINSLGTWTKLPAAAQNIRDIVHGHVSARATGNASIIEGATHFLNPFFASALAMQKWGEFVVAHAVAKFGNEEKKDIHFHGTAPGSGKPRGYILKRGDLSFQFTPDGQPVQRIATADAMTSFSATGISRGTTFRERTIQNTLAEWNFFAQGARKEGDDPQFRRIGTYWQSVGEDFDGRTLIPGSKPGTLINPAWSAAFISYVVRVSGGGDRFRYAQAHSIYVQDLVNGRPGGIYEAMRPESYVPQAGDLIHAGRESAKRFDFDAARQAFKADKRYASHSDLVVEVRQDEGILITIGGNVNQSVSRKRVKLNSDGTLKTRRDSIGVLPWIAVLRCLE
ncbi:cell wall hydrolase [Rhizobium sp. PP-CC-2G-626]|nr:cell wall hydrolase [Rhizobium sp. PP-CC-2G-626]